MPVSSQWFANPGVDYEIDQSCRFNDNDSPYLYRTPGSAGNQKTNTISCWVKRTNLGLGNSMSLFSAASGDYGLTWYIDSSETDTSRERLSLSTGHANLWQADDYKLRDPASWYHFVFAMDTTQGTQSNRMKVYINGELITGDTNALDENTDYAFFDDVVNRIGSWTPSGGAAGRYMEGYMSEIHFIDGAQKAATDFGKTDSATGQWIPIEYESSYGTQGAYLAFQDSSALGDDTSGNGNDWSTSGLAAADKVTDTPTTNYCIINTLSYDSSQITLQDGNLRASWNTPNGDGGTAANCTFNLAEFKCYWEFQASGGSINYGLGIANTPNQWRKAHLDSTTPFQRMRYGTYGGSTADMQVTSGHGSVTDTGVNAITGSEVGMMAYDPDSGKFWVGQDGTWFNSGDPTDGSNPQGEFTCTDPIFVNLSDFSSAEDGDVTLNFGQTGFAHTPPTGYKALNSSNIPNPTTADPSAYFQTTLYTGNGSTQSIDQSENKSFEPDLVWIKNRDAADSHILTDAVRGATKVINSDATAAEVTDADTLTAFESNGFALGDDDKVNTNTEKYVAWQWLESSTPGFDIVSFTGNATARTISHSLGVAPEMMFVKNLADTDNWAVYHASNTSAPATDYLILNTNAITADDATIWNDTAPTSSVFSVGTSSLTNGNTEAMIAYLWASVTGFSKIGKYAGTGTITNQAGAYIYTGFRPAWVMIKEADTSARDWIVQDAARNPHNVANLQLLPNSSAAEATTFYSQSAAIDIVSNGFKLRSSTVRVSETDATYVYAAFAHAPFKTANAR
jgi:hypothetical protein